AKATASCFGFAAIARLVATKTATSSKLFARLAFAIGVSRTSRFLGFQAFYGFRRNRLADEVLDATNLMALGVRGQCVGQPATPGSSGAANTVNIVFCLHG